jgi:hypothetical protein
MMDQSLTNLAALIRENAELRARIRRLEQQLRKGGRG